MRLWTTADLLGQCGALLRRKGPSWKLRGALESGGNVSWLHFEHTHSLVLRLRQEDCGFGASLGYTERPISEKKYEWWIRVKDSSSSILIAQLSDCSKFTVFTFTECVPTVFQLVSDPGGLDIWEVSSCTAQCFGNGFFGMIEDWISGKGKLLCGLLSAVECWFQEDLVFGEQKEKFKQLPGLGNRRSLFWVRSSAVPSSLWREKNEEVASEARHTHIFLFFSREERSFLGEIQLYLLSMCVGAWHGM